MKKKLTVLIGLLFIVSSTHGRISRSNIWRARNLVKGAKLYYEQTLPFLYEYLTNIGLSRFARTIKEKISEVERLENSVEMNLQSRLNSSEKNALATDRRNLELYQILMNAKVPDEINLLFDKLENITRNVSTDIRDYRKEIAEILPRKLEIDQKIMGLQKQIASLQAEKNKMLTSIQPNLDEYYQKMKYGSDYIFQQTKRIGNAIEQRAKDEYIRVDTLQKKIENLKKSRVNPTLLKQLENAKKTKLDLFEKVTAETSRLGESEMIRLASIVDLLNRVDLTTNAILHGPGEVKKWELARDIYRIKDPSGKTLKHKPKPKPLPKIPSRTPMMAYK